MVMDTAVCLLGCGGGLLLLAAGWNSAARVCGCVIVVFAASTLAQFVLGRPLGLDDLFWPAAGRVSSSLAPGRIAPNAGIAVFLAGLSLLLMTPPLRHRAGLTITGVALLTLAVLPLLGYFAAIPDAGAPYSGMALPTIVCLLLLANAILRFASRLPIGHEPPFPPMLAAAVSLLISIGVVSGLTNADLIASQQRIVRSQAIQASIDQIVSRVARMESNARGYAIGGRETMRLASIAHADELLRNLAVLDHQVADDPVRRSQATQLRRRALEKIAHNTTVLEARRATGGLAAPALIILSPSAAAANAMISLGNEMKAAERDQLARDEAAMALLAKSTYATQILGSLVALALVGLTVVQTRRAATARRAAEAERQRTESARAEVLGRLEKIGRLVPGMIYQYRMRPDGTSGFPYCSDGIREIFGLTPDEVRDDASKVFAAIHPDDVERIRKSNQESARTLGSWHREYRVRHADGIDRCMLGRAVPEQEPDGSVLWHGFVTDITERKQLEDNLARARDQALEASRLKSEFLATISHEIRTPMNSVIGMAALLAEAPLSDEHKDMARTICSGAENLLTIINDILDFSKIEAGRMRIDRVEFDLRRLVEETLALQAHRANEKGLTLIGKFESLPDPPLVGDDGRVRQVLTNLVGNAIKFTLAGKVEVRVRLLSETETRTHVRIQVSDTGIGIPLKAQRNLFEPFMQADGSSTRRFGGTGLGLAISRQLVTLMGGTIGFESEPDQGSTFWFELDFGRPAAAAPARSAPTFAAHATAALPTTGPFPLATSSGAGHLPKKRLLVAEDNPSNQKVVVMLLTKMGYDVTLAENGTAALATLAAGSFDAVLMDCQMPDVDGYETTRQIRSGKLPGVNAEIPVIAVSAHARPEDRIRSLQAGMNDHVSKPIRLVELQAALLRAGLATDPSPPTPANLVPW